MTQLRLEKLRQSMANIDCEALLITNEVNRQYMTGFTGTSGVVLVTEQEAILFTDFRYTEQAEAQAPHYSIIDHGTTLIAQIRDVLLREGIKRLYFEAQHMTYQTYQTYLDGLEGIELTPSKQVVEQLRMIKDESELKILREAAALADQAFMYIIDHMKPGVSEKRIAFLLEIFMREHGATSSSFDMIVASGERSAMPHGVASDRLLGQNEFVTLDFGAYYQGYCSDITRTVVIGKPTPKHREIYDIVLEAQMNGLEHIKPGMSGQQADALTRDIIKRYGYGDQFGHSTGHGIGMEIHEEPRLSMTSETVLQPGMTVTVEPGIYIPTFGGVRIEDDIVITEDGAERLTLSSKELICIE